MFKKKCSGCAKKIERKFNYCPYCGVSLKAGNDGQNFGMLGRNDADARVQQNLGLPLGLNGIVNTLVKQLEGQLENMDLENNQGMPKNIKIRVARGPGMNQGQIIQKVPEKKLVDDAPEISEKENKRRMSLAKVESESRVKRLGDTIIYEINTPGVKKKGDVVLTELATGLEVKAYSKDKCYVKFIPLKVEVVEYSVEKEKVIVEIKG